MGGPAQSPSLRQRSSSYRLSNHVARLSSPPDTRPIQWAPSTISPRSLSISPFYVLRHSKEGNVCNASSDFAFTLSLSTATGMVFHATGDRRLKRIGRAPANERSLPVALAPPAESSTSASVRPSVDAVQRSKVFFEANVGVAEHHACHARARACRYAHAAHVDGPGITPLWMKQKRKHMV